MAYDKKQWFSGETITASKLNRIENGIDDLDKSTTNLINNLNSEIQTRTSEIDTLTNNLNSEIQTRTNEATTLKSRVDQIIAPTGEAPNPSEITDARVGADGTTYDTLGNAIRGQVTDLKSHIDDFATETQNLFNKENILDGYALNTNTGAPFAVSGYFATSFIPVVPGTKYNIQIFSSETPDLWLIEYTSSLAFVKRETKAAQFTPEETVAFIRFSAKKSAMDYIMLSKFAEVEKGTYYPYQWKVKGEAIMSNSVLTDGIRDDAVTPAKANFLRTEGNLFRADTIETGKSIDTNTGIAFPVDGYYISDFIKVDSNTAYCINIWPYLVLEYSADKKFVRRATLNTTTLEFTTSANTEYVRLNLENSVTASGLILQAGKWITTMPEDSRDVLSEEVCVGINSIKNVVLMKSENLFDKDDIVTGLYLLGNGTLMAVENYFTSNFIPCKANTTYNFTPNGMERIVFYDIDKTLLEARTGVFGDFTTPVNTAYLRFTNSLSRAVIDRVQLTEGAGIGSFEPYDKYGIVPKRQHLTTLAEAWWRWSKGERYPIGFLGDSTTDGAGTTHGETHEKEDNAAGGFGKVDYINPDAYPYKVEQLCRTELSSDTLRVYNIGYNGTYYNWAIPKYDAIFGDAYADVKMVGLVYGINDRTIYTTPYDYFAEFRNNLVYTIEYLYARGIQPFLVTTQATVEPNTQADMPNFTMRSSLYIKTIADEVMHSIAKRYDLEIIDMNAFDEYMLIFGKEPVSVVVPDTLHFSDYGNTLEAQYIFSVLNMRTIQIKGDCTLSFVNQLCKSDVYSNVLAKPRLKTNGFGTYVDYERDVTSNIVLQDFWINNLADGPIRITAYCPEVLQQTVTIDDVETPITSTEQLVATLDVGIHHIVAMSGETAKLSWYGFRVEVA